jgi:tetratricopeptide (TPR) repeat protein
MIFRFLAIPALALLLPVIAAFANDPSALFLKAYQDYQCGENFERDGRLRDAMNSYASTVAILEQVRKDDPSWQEMVVNFRMRKAQQNIERLRVVVAAEPEKLPNHEDPLPTLGFEIDIPEPLVTTRPRQTNQAAPKIPASSSNSDRQEIESLERQVAEFKKSLSTEKKLREKMEGELASSKMELEKTKIELVSINSRFAQAEDAFKNVAQERDELRKKAGEPPDKKIEILSGRIATLEAENEVANENNTRLVEKLKRAADYISGIKNVLTATDEDRRNLATERNSALGRIKSLKDNMAELKTLRDQNASLQKELATQKTDLSRLAKIEWENANLARKLDASEVKLADASISGQLSEAETERLREDLALMQERLAASRVELASRDASVKSLASQLEKVTGDLTASNLNSGPSEEQQRLYSESQLLRQIVIRQMSEQSQRAQAVSDLESELQRLQVKSEALASSLGILSNAPPIMRDEELDLLHDPRAVLQNPPSEGGDLSLTVVKSAKAPQNKSSGGARELSDDAKQLATQASELVKQRRFAEAEEKYQQIVGSEPSNHFVLANLGVIQIRLENLPAAKASLEKSLILKNDNHFAMVNLANVHYQQGRVDEAIGLLRKAIPLDPQNAVAHYYLAVALEKKGDMAEAEKSYIESLSINPNYANAHFHLALMYANAQSPSLLLAKTHYEKAKALGTEPDSSLESRLAQIQPSN